MKLRTLHASVALSCLVTFALTIAGTRDVHADQASLPTATQPGAADSTGGVPESGGQTSTAILAAPSVDPATGLLSTSIPIQAPSARGNAQPGIGVTYSSEGGDGYLGSGWDLTVPSIVRSPRSGPPTYDDLPTGGPWTPQDDFYASGARLMPVCYVNSDASCVGGPGESIPRAFANYWYFREETETTFNRYFLSRDQRTWVIQSKAGVTTELGAALSQTASFRVFVPDAIELSSAGKPYRWHIVRKYDAQGDATSHPNAIYYIWKPLLGNANTGGRLYLMDVYDTLRAVTARGADFLGSGDFAHHIAIHYEIPWLPATTFQPPIHRAPILQRVSGIDVTSALANDTTKRELVRRYHFAYHSVGRRSYLDSVQMEGRCPTAVYEADTAANPTLPATSCLMRPATLFRYSESSPISTAFDVHRFAGSLPTTPVLADVNTDGLPDFLGPSDTRNSQPVALNGVLAPDNAGLNSGIMASSGNGPWDPWSTKALNSAGDFAVDGKLNAAWINTAKADFASPIPSGTAWTWNITHSADLSSLLLQRPDSVKSTDRCGRDYIDWLYPEAQGEIPYGTGDVDGDGYPDLLTTTAFYKLTCGWFGDPEVGIQYKYVPVGAATIGITIHATDRMPDGTLRHFVRALGDQPLPNVPGSELVPASSRYAFITTSDVLGGAHVIPEDMNGDGLVDLAFVAKTGITFVLGRGDGTVFPGATLGSTLSAVVPGMSAIADVSRIYLHDLNGDGMADIVQANDAGFALYLNRDGANFDKAINGLAFVGDQMASGAWDLSKVRFLFSDMNGSGVDDLVAVDTTSGATAYIDFYQGRRPGLLWHIINEQGGRSTIAHDSTTNLAYLAFKAGQPWTRHMAQVLHHVVSITTDNQLPQPFQQSRTTQYVYRDPIYDARERRFVGFSHVRKIDVGEASGKDDPTSVVDTTYLSGLCELDDPGTSCPAANTLDRIYRPLAAHPLLVETSDGNGNYLATAHTTWYVQPTVSGTNGIVGRFAYSQSSEAFLYDTGTPSSGTSPRVVTDACLFGKSPCATETLTLHASAGLFTYVSSAQVLDAVGNRTSSTENGVVGVDQAIHTTTTWQRPPGEVTGWLWRKHSDALDRFITPGPFNDDPRYAVYTYDVHGNFMSSSEQLVGSVPLARKDAAQRAVAPKPTTASTEGSTVTAWTFASDDLGNRVFKIGSNHGGCEVWTYDDLYAQLIVTDTVYGVSGDCTGPAKTTTTTHDRGLDAPRMVTQPDLSYVTTSYDTFGRASVVSKSGTTAPNAASVIYTPVDVSPTLVRPGYRMTQTWDGSGYRTTYTFVDGLGTALFSARQAAASDAPYTWIISGTHRFGARGHAVDTFQPFFSKSDPLTLASAMSLGTQSRHTSYDAFGRVVWTRGLDGVQDSELHYHALAVDTYDAVHLPAASSTAYATTVKDGHGRSTQSITRGHVGSSTALTTATTTTVYTVTGQAARITRTDGSAVVIQDMDYDSLGRLVESRDANSTTGTNDWRYVYDDFDRLVGTSDPRGCGENISYDVMGREIGEDFSPCTADHPDYSPAYLSGGGSEVAYIYDAPLGYAKPTALDGRLYAVLDLAANTSFAYDLRGRMTHSTRALAKPGAGASTWKTRYAANAFAYDLTYDDANRVTSRSTGANATELQVAGQSTVRPNYDERGHIQSVDSSYGPLVTATQFDVDDLPLRYQYGDAAKTAATFDYNGTRRLWHANILRTAGWAQASPVGDGSTREAALQELSFTYDAVGNPRIVTDKSDSDPAYPSVWPTGAKPIRTRTIGYDDLYHVTSVAYDTGGDRFTPPFDAEFTAQNAGHQTATSPTPALFRANRVTSQTFNYDWMGNLTASDDDSKTFLDRSLGTIVNSTTAPNQMVSASNVNGNLSANYDVAGNTVSVIASRSGTCVTANQCQGTKFLYAWDELGRLAHASRLDLQAVGGTSGGFVEQVAFTYSYDANGSRILKAATVNGSTTYSAEIFSTLRLDGATYDSATSKYKDDATTEGVYLVASTAPLARLAYAASDPRTATSGARHVFFELKDVLGSSAFVVDQDTGELVERTTYQPYGAVESDYRPARWASFREPYKFTEKEEDIGVGIVFFGARYYAPALGRFLSPDPLAVRAHKGDLNPYAYVSGRVFVATDPTGLDEVPGASIPLPQENGNGSSEGAEAVLTMVDQMKQLIELANFANQMATQMADEQQVEAENGAISVTQPVLSDSTQVGPEGPDYSSAIYQTVVPRADTRIDRSEDLIQYGNIALATVTLGEGAAFKLGVTEMASALSSSPVVADLGALAGKTAVDEVVPQLGGSYRAVRAAATEAGLGGEVHHMPSFSALSNGGSELTYGRAPSIWMSTADHAETLSHGAQGLAGIEYRAAQQALIENGQFLDALKLDVDSIRAVHGAKYDEAFQQMSEYLWR